ncbi:MAG: hypothetical protein J3K34DRAFT_521338 [Monoraphidium minutum]|nr:MAG: hypothetical protein J3K34DRAFT_521338 [Monoraphidium minutum]
MARRAAALLALLLALAAAAPLRGARAEDAPLLKLEPLADAPAADPLTEVPLLVPQTAPSAAASAAGGLAPASIAKYKYACPKIGGVQSVEWRATFKDDQSKSAGTFSICWDHGTEFLVWIHWVKLTATAGDAAAWANILGGACSISGNPRPKSTRGVVQIMLNGGVRLPVAYLELRKGTCL